MSRRFSSSCTAAQSASGRSACADALRAGGYSRHSNSSPLKLSHVSSRPAFCARSTYSATLALPTPLARLACRWLKPHTSSKRNTSWTFRILSLLAGICLPSEARVSRRRSPARRSFRQQAGHPSDDPQKVAAFTSEWVAAFVSEWVAAFTSEGWPPSRRNRWPDSLGIPNPSPRRPPHAPRPRPRRSGRLPLDLPPRRASRGLGQPPGERRPGHRHLHAPGRLLPARGQGADDLGRARAVRAGVAAGGERGDAVYGERSGEGGGEGRSRGHVRALRHP